MSDQMDADRLKELREKISSGQYVFSANDCRDFAALIDSALQPAGEVGEIVELRRNLEFCQQTSEARNKRICELLEQLAALSHPGEQQQLVEALVYSLGRLVEEVESITAIDTDEEMQACLKDAHAALSAHKASDVPTTVAKCATCHRVQCTCTGLIPIEGWCDLCGYPENNGQTHKQDSEHGLICNVPANQSAAPTAGDAALREAAKDQIAELRAIARLHDYKACDQAADLLERFAGVKP